MKKCLLATAIAFTLTGCGFEVIPPASKGKLLSPSGYSSSVEEPGRVFVMWYENVVVLDTSTQTLSEQLKVKMADNLDLNFSIRFRTRIGGDTKTINAMFNDIKHEQYQISLPRVYEVYGRDVVQNVGRSVVGKYTVEDVAKNFDKITEDMHKLLTEKMKGSPLEISNITLADITYPDVITKAIEAQQERKLAIETETNNQAVEMVKKENALKLAEADYKIRMTRAQALRDENKTISEGLDPMLIKYRQLDVMEALKDNQNAVFIPYEAFSETGISNRIFSK